MEYKVLGTSGINVSKIGLGTMTFGGQVDENTALHMIDEALDFGVNFIDVADVYVEGKSEEIVGKAIKNKRDKIVLASKCGGAMSTDINDKGLSRATILRHVEASLRRLNTEYLDILYLHFPDPAVGFEEMILTIDILIRSGKIRTWGISNFPAWQCCALHHTAKELKCQRPIVSQNAYNLLTRGLDDELLPFLEKYNMGLVVFNPLAGGLLTGKHRKGNIANGSRFDLDKGYAKRYCKPSNIVVADEFTDIAHEAGISPAQLALVWVLSKNYVTSVLCGASKPEQLRDNLQSCEIDVSSETLSKCDLLWDEIRGDYFNYHY